ncbi:MAG: hypothetical protein ACE5HJ_02750 [Thermoplasmata archaeon]
MTDRCPRCRNSIDNPKSLTCPTCGYSLRLPLVGKIGAALVIGGLISFLLAIFYGEMWMDILLAGISAITAGMAALFASGWMLGRAGRT